MKKRQWLRAVAQAMALIVAAAAVFCCDNSAGPKSGTAVTLSNLTAFVKVPAGGRVVPVISIDTPQFKGTGVWQTAGGVPVTDGAFAEGGVYKAVVTLTEKPGYTLSGVRANYFTHAGAASISNAADSGKVTITFGAAPSRPAPLWMPTPADITNISALNNAEPVIDSHAYDTNVRHLELNRREFYEQHYGTGGGEANHSARLKKLKNGSYLMIWQNGQVGAQIFCAYSDDLEMENWTNSSPFPLFAQEENYVIYIKGDPTLDNKSWNTCDAVELQDGRLMAVATFFAAANYRNTNTGDGLAIRTSTDNGKTWGPYQEIFRGRNWECHIMQLPPKPGQEWGEIQVFCTSPVTSYEIQFGIPDHIQVTSSGTIIVRSLDNGETWISHMPENEYYAYTVAQSWHHMENGINRYTNQMPVAVQLHNGTAAIALEDIRDGNNTDGFGGNRISVAYSDNNWTEYAGPNSVMGMVQNVPSDRGDQLWQGSAPYILQFPSGETCITYNVGNPNHPANPEPKEGWNALSFRLGDYRARNFEGEYNRAYIPYQPYDLQGVYGAMDLEDSHTILHTYSHGPGGQKRHIIISKLILNHTIFPGRKTAAGYNSEAFFIGSDSQAQAAIRAAWDDDYLYLLVERLDEDLQPEYDVIDLYLHADGTRTLNDSSLGLTAGLGGIVATYRYQDAWKLQEATETAAVGIQTASYPFPEGYTVEVAIPRAAIGAKGGSVNIAFVLHNKDDKVSRPLSYPLGKIKDTLFNVNLDKPYTWLTMVTD